MDYPVFLILLAIGVVALWKYRITMPSRRRSFLARLLRGRYISGTLKTAFGRLLK